MIVIFLIYFGLQSYSQYNAFSVLNGSNMNAVVSSPSNLVTTKGVEFSLAPLAYTQFDAVFPFSISAMFLLNGNNQYSLSFPSISQNTKVNNSVYSTSNIAFLYIALKGKTSYWNFYISDQIVSAFGFDKTFIDFLNLGNKSFIGTSINFSLFSKAIHFRKYSFSWAKEVNNRFDIGITGNMYFGKSMIDLQPKFELFTHSELDYVELKMGGIGQISLPLSFIENENGRIEGVKTDFNFKQYQFGIENPGFGINFGINYKFSKRLSSNFNISDLGIIYWNSENKNITIDGTYNWDGIDVSDIINIKRDSTVLENIINTQIFDTLSPGLISYNNQNSYMYTPVGFGVGVLYEISNKINIAFNSHLQYFNPFVRSYFSATGSLKIRESWNLMSGLSFTNNSYFNVPAGIAFRNERIKATFTLSNLWGTFVPTYTNRFGASISFCYRLLVDKSTKGKHDVNYPFYLDDRMEGIKIR